MIQPARFLLLTLLAPTLSGFLAGCGPDRSQIIAEKVAERVNEYRKKEALKCRVALLEQAESIADSLLIEDAKELLADSLSSLRPYRPVQPAPVPALDSSPVAPIFKTPPTDKTRQ